MQIEAGKFYRTRDGRKVGPVKPSDGNDAAWWVDGLGLYRADGTFGYGVDDASCPPYDLTAEWTDELPHGHARLPSGAVVDLTAITTPFGLLDADTQEALRAHGGPWEIFTRRGFECAQECAWVKIATYRVKPQPPAPKVETVTIEPWEVATNVLSGYRITFNLIDGQTAPASIRMVAL